MNLKKISLYILCLTVGFVSCKKDDDEEVVITPPRDRAEQQIADMDSINKYLDSHYYNSSAFGNSNPDPSLTDIIIKKLTNGETVPDGYTLLKNAVEKRSIVYAGTNYEYYILKINQGGGSDSPTFADDIRVNYEGFTLNDVIFDSSVNSVYFDLVVDIGVEGWRRVFPEFNAASSFVDNNDGTVNFINPGIGVMFLPSGLAYFSGSIGGSTYNPIIFKFELLQTFQNDHDGDGIPSYLEDVDGNGELLDNTDNDFTFDNFGNSFPRYDYVDTDDDGDGILTKNEITISKVTKSTLEEVKNTPLEYNQVLLNKIVKEQNGNYTGTIITFKDTDGVKPFNYLDKNN